MEHPTEDLEKIKAAEKNILGYYININGEINYRNTTIHINRLGVFKTNALEAVSTLFASATEFLKVNDIDKIFFLFNNKNDPKASTQILLCLGKKEAESLFGDKTSGEMSNISFIFTHNHTSKTDNNINYEAPDRLRDKARILCPKHRITTLIEPWEYTRKYTLSVINEIANF